MFFSFLELHLAFPRTSQNRQAGTLTPRTINSLTAITAEHGHEGEEEEWENDMRGWNGDEVRAPVPNRLENP